VFSVYLPADEVPEEAGQAPAKQPIRGGKETILVAEDEPTVLNLIAATLRTAGYGVLTACDGNDAVRVFEECGGAVDLAVLDVVMPGLSGRETMERIRTMNARTLFLFSSGYSPSSIHKNFIIEDGLHLIRKPYRREDLLIMVRKILDVRDAEGVCKVPDKDTESVSS
jgi:DNA-binding response OmpR family regulator